MKSNTKQLFSFFTLKINICKKHPPRRVPQKTHSRNICNYAKNTVLREKFVRFFRTPVLWNNCEQLAAPGFIKFDNHFCR